MDRDIKTRECPKCGESIEQKVNFCPFCGASIKDEDKKRRNKIIIGATIFFIVLALAEITYNLWFSTKMSTPFSYSAQIGTTNVKLIGNYNKNQNKIYLSLVTDQIIKPWQIEALNGNKPEITIKLKEPNGQEKTFKQPKLTFEAGKALSAVYTEENAKLKDYIKIRRLVEYGVSNSNSIEIEHSSYINFDVKQREKIKKDFYKQKEQERQRKLQAEAAERQRQLELQAARQRLYNYFNYGYYGYY